MSNRSDNFNRANGSLGTPSDGGSAWVQAAGTWQVSSNLAVKTASTVTWEVAYLEASSSVGTVACTMVSGTAANAGLAGRVADNNNFILGLWHAAAAQMFLYKRVAGTFTQLGSTFNGTLAANDIATLDISAADAIAFKQNGTTRVSATDSAGSSNTKWGLSDYQLQGQYDDWGFTDNAVAAAASPAPVITRQAVQRASRW